MTCPLDPCRINKMADRITFLENVSDETASLVDLAYVRKMLEAKIEDLESLLFEGWIPELQGRIAALEEIVGTLSSTRPSVKKMKNWGE